MSDLLAITGNLTSTPERRDVAGGVTMVTFGLASTERRLENGVWSDVHTNFYNVSVFRKLAEHAAQSLEKGQRVIVAGKLKVRAWEANGRSGTSVDLEASSIGPDLLFGVATFTKDARAGGAYEAPRDDAPATEWASPAALGAAMGETGSEASADRDSAAAEAPALVAAGGWGAPQAEDGTPF